MRVYKFLNHRWALDNIRHRRIKNSDFDTLNDPFELFAVDLSDVVYRDKVLERVDYMIRGKQLLCFSASWASPLLWAHYADSHRGICLGLDIEDKYGKHFRPIEYWENRLEEQDPPDGQFVVDLLFKKYFHWRYEEEIRGVLPSTGLSYTPFDKDFRLGEIILGCRCTVKNARLAKALKGYARCPKITRAVLAHNSFQVLPGPSVDVRDLSPTS